MAAPTRDEFRKTSRFIERALRVVEDTSHSLRQKLLARELSRTLPPEEWVPKASGEPGLTADELRQRAAELRSSSSSPMLPAQHLHG